MTGRWPALVGVDYAEFGIKSRSRRTVQWLMNAISMGRFDKITHDNLATHRPNRVALEYWRAGGLVTVGVHFYNPANPRGGGLRDQGVDIAGLITRGSATHRRWMEQLDRVALALQELRDAGVVVLWRPFHEMDGDWFWWGKKNPATFIRAWRDMVAYFVDTKGLDHLLWVYNPSSGARSADYYLGNKYVAVVGLDVYTDHVDPTHVPGYHSLSARRKPIGLGEFGPHGSVDPPGNFDYRRLLCGVRKHFPRTSIFMEWNANWSPANNTHVQELYLDPHVVTRADIPPSTARACPLSSTRGASARKAGSRFERSPPLDQSTQPRRIKKPR